METTKSTSDTTLNPANVAIIGAGIGGLALAIGLLRQNVSYTLYEAAAEYSTIGAGVGLGPNALRAMDMIDPRFRALYEKISSGNLTPNKNHVMMDALLMEEGFGKKQGIDPVPYGADCYDRTSCHRKALLDIMTSLIPLSTVKFNKRLKSLVQEKGKVIITFEDGEITEANSVIGCDGVKGATRAVVLGEKYPDQVEATYSGKYAYRSIVPMKDAIEIMGEHAGDAKMFMGPGANMTTFPISKGTACNVVAFKFNETPWEHKDWTRAVSPEVMFNDFSVGVDKRLVKLLQVWLSLVDPEGYAYLTICAPVFNTKIQPLVGKTASMVHLASYEYTSVPQWANLSTWRLSTCYYTSPGSWCWSVP